MSSRRSINKFLDNPSIVEQRAIEYAEKRQELIEALSTDENHRIDIHFDQCVHALCALSDVIFTLRKWRKPRHEDYK